jgi:hypothetical protein
MLKSRLSGTLIMRSIPIVGETSIELARSYEGIANFLLLDSHRPSDRQVGAFGFTHDWSISRRIVELVRTPVILAGGLGPDPVGWDQIKSPKRFTLWGAPESIPKPRPTKTARTLRILIACDASMRPLGQRNNDDRPWLASSSSNSE